MINPNECIPCEGIISQVHDIGFYTITLYNGKKVESELTNKHFNIGDKIKGIANYSILAESYIIREINYG